MQNGKERANIKKKINLRACQDSPVYARVKIKPTILQSSVGLGLSLAGNSFIGSFQLVLLIFELHGANHITARENGKFVKQYAQEEEMVR